MFPVEIWEEILKHVEAKDLVRFKRVSRTWDAIIEKILERSDVWYRQFVNDIPYRFWASLLEHQTNEDLEELEFHKIRTDSEVWLQMYKSWKEWHRIVEKNPEIRTFEPLPQHRTRELITCVAALGRIIAIGSTEGYIAFYDTARNRIFYRADHAEFLENVQLFRRGTVLLACSLSINQRIKFWNLQTKHEEKPLQCTGSFIAASGTKCFTVRNDLLTRYDLSRSNSKNEGPLLNDIYLGTVLLRIPLQGSEILAAGADNYALTLCTAKNRHMRSVWILDNTRVEGSQINEPEIQVRYYRIFMARITVCIGVFGEVGFSIYGGRWKIYNLFTKFGAPVTTVLFHVALLALGLQSGEVYLFTVKDVKTLENFDFDTAESRKLMLDTEAIISLNVTEQDSAQYIVAASNRHVHLVKFK